MKPLAAPGLATEPLLERGLMAAVRSALRQANAVQFEGLVVQALGTVVRATGVDARVGEVCELHATNGRVVRAEVVGFDQNIAILSPFGELDGLSCGSYVVPLHRALDAPVGHALLGRVLDGFGEPIDGRGPLTNAHAEVTQNGVARLPSTAVRRASTNAAPPEALSRRPITQRFETGVRALDALAAIGCGQRLGVFAPAGVGKSTLTGMLARGAKCDVRVIALIGERGREVGEFIEHNLGAEGMASSVVVVSTSDRPAVERAKSAQVAMTIAEAFRADGKRVLLVMDSVTRYARALREIGLASGEPPTRRGYPPSVFASLPRLLERAGNDAHGSITAFFTVLTEGEDDSDPIAEEVRSILDGHIVLSRKLAQQNQYPAIDVLASLSRVASHITSAAEQRAASKLRDWLAKFNDVELLVQVGEYRAGSDALADQAVERVPHIREWLKQSPTALSPLERTLGELAALETGDHAG
jgi:ATP synthase in type III secretion protein N